MRRATRPTGWGGRTWLSIGVLVAVVAACGEPSRVAPDAAVTVGGVVLFPDGAPATQRPVKLGTGITEGEVGFAVLTVGLSCTSGACRGKVRDATTDGAGHYSFALQGRDTQSSFGEAVSVLVSATGPPSAAQVSGPMASARFRVQASSISLPNLELVDPGLSIEPGAGVVARWSTTRSGPYELSYENDSEVPVWLVRTVESSVGVDPRLLEDTAGRVVVAGTQESSIEGSKVELRWRSPGVGYAAGAGAPPSRGRPCRWVDAVGATSADATSCELTDGDLVGAVSSLPVCPVQGDGSACTPATAAIIDLAEAVPAELVVVRGCDGGCALEVSADGTTYRSAGSVSDDFGAAALDGQPIRSVRVGLGAGAGLREVSVWGPAPEHALLPLDADRRTELAAPYGRSDAGARPSALLVALAAVAAAMVLVGAGVVLGRRRAAPLGG